MPSPCCNFVTKTLCLVGCYQIFVCEVAGEFGRLPKGWARLFEANAEFYYTYDVKVSEYDGTSGISASSPNLFKFRKG